MTPDPAGQACAQCGRVVPNHSLIYDGSARMICTRCEADVVSGGIAKSNMLRLTLGPLGLALIGTFTFCLPVLNIFLPVVFGVLALLGQRFEGLGLLGSDSVSAFARLQTFRGLADYSARARLPSARAVEEVAAARRFVEEAQALLRAGGWID